MAEQCFQCDEVLVGSDRDGILCVGCVEFLASSDYLMKDKERILEALEILKTKIEFLTGYGKDAEGVLLGVDVLFVGHDDELVPANRCIMAGRSPVLKSMFATGMIEKESEIVRVSDSTGPVIRAMVNFCYSAHIGFTNEAPLEDVMKLAHRYMIPQLVEACEEELRATMHEGNVFARIKLAHHYGLKDLMLEARSFVESNIHSVFLALLKELFDDGDLEAGTTRKPANDGVRKKRETGD